MPWCIIYCGVLLPILYVTTIHVLCLHITCSSHNLMPVICHVFVRNLQQASSGSNIPYISGDKGDHSIKSLASTSMHDMASLVSPMPHSLNDQPCNVSIDSIGKYSCTLHASLIKSLHEAIHACDCVAAATCASVSIFASYHTATTHFRIT
jgi:hypothetical protein